MKRYWTSVSSGVKEVEEIGGFTHDESVYVDSIPVEVWTPVESVMLLRRG